MFEFLTMAEGGTGTYSSKEKLNTGGDQKRIAGDGGISSNTVEVQGLSAGASQEVVEMYFENSRRSGGGDIEEVQIKDGIAYITFVEAETAQRVVSHSSHQVAGQTLTVTLYHPPPTKPCYDNRVLVQELNSAVTEELLINFLVTETGSKVTEMLYGEEAGRVVVTFSSSIDFDAVRKACRETRIKSTFLQVAKVAISNCILVWNIQLSASRDVILLYFENKRRSGGGEVEKVEMVPEERYCLVYFEDNTVIDRVLSQTHKIDGADVKVHLHHECLGRRSSTDRSHLCFKISNTGNKDTASLDNTPTEISIKGTSSSMSSDHEKESDFVQVPEWQINDGRDCVLFLLVQYRKTHGTKIVRDIKKVQCSLLFLSFWNFCTRKKQGQQMLNEILQKHCCSVTVSSEMDDMFVFEVNGTCFEKESDFEDFLNVVLHSVYKCAQQSLFSDVIVFDNRLQEDVQERVNQSQELDCAWIKLIGEHGTDGMYVVCIDKNKMAVLHVVTEIIADAKKCFENHEEVVFVDPMWHRVMTKFEYVKNISDKFPHLTITTVETRPSFVLKGLRDDSKAAADNLKQLLETAHMEVQEDIFSPGCHFEILTYPEMQDYINNCIALPSTNFIWMPNPQTKNMHIFYRKSEVVRGLGKLIKACIKEKAYVFAKEDDMIKVEKSKSVEDLKNKYKGRTMIHAVERGTLVVTAADDIFESVDAGIQKVIKNVRAQSSQSACSQEKFITQPDLKASKILNEKEELHLAPDIVLKKITVQQSAISAADKKKIPGATQQQQNYRQYEVNKKNDQEPISNRGNGSKNDKGEENECCTICMCPQSDPKSLSCGHSFCSECIEQMFKHKPVCPVCGKIMGTITGDQPKDGTMTVRTSLLDLAGFEGLGSIVITYDFPAGRQGPNHPSPGVRYGHMTRTAYLPNTPEGKKVCRMLLLAFDRRLVFTISQSRTTGKEGLTWNDIHHKTNPNPGTQFGYPDPEYLSRVKEELAAKGITEADIQPE